jgi:predicted DNA-binding transcriptional regulator AlpA
MTLQRTPPHGTPMPAAEQVDPVDPVGLLDKRALMRKLRLSQPSIDRLRKTDPDFPKPIWIAPKSARWRPAEVEAWVETRKRGGVAPMWLKLKNPPHTRKPRPKGKPKKHRPPSTRRSVKND